MLKFVVDENLPYYFQLWHNKEFIHVFDLSDISSDEDIWIYARKNDLVIITKDADFSNKILLSSPPPKIIHLKIGNLKISDFHKFLNKVWPSVLQEIEGHKLINVYLDRIESFE